MLNKGIGWMVLLLLLGGCKVGPEYAPPCTEVPCEWHSIPSEGMDSADSPDCFLWWESLNDPLLNSLIERASVQNLEMHIAATRILEARLEKKGGYAAMFPHLDGSAAYQHVYYSKDALVNGLLGTAIPISPDAPVKRNVDFFEIGFDVEWEIDLFGVTAHDLAALQAHIEASEESLCDIWITLSAEIARTYIELRGLQQRSILMQKNIEMHQDAISLTKVLVDIGKAGTINLLQSQEQLSQLSAQKPLLDVAMDKAIHRLSILLAYHPDELFAELCQVEKLPEIPLCKPLGLPSELLRRRPDIRKAERELAAATERVGSAIAGMFPRFSLVGFVGDITTHLPSLTNPASAAWSAGPSMLLPIFNSTMIMQDINLNKIKTRQALYAYQKTVLDALEETENAIASFHYGMERRRFLAEAERANQQAYEYMVDLYRNGFKDYLEVIAITAALIASEDEAIQGQMDLLFHYISLYKALGGGWEIADCCNNKLTEH